MVYLGIDFAAALYDNGYVDENWGKQEILMKKYTCMEVKNGKD